MTNVPEIPIYPFNGTETDKNLYHSTMRELILRFYATQSYADSVGLPEGVEGDILYHDGSTWVKLSKGSGGAVLTMSGNLPVWA